MTTSGSTTGDGNQNTESNGDDTDGGPKNVFFPEEYEVEEDDEGNDSEEACERTTDDDVQKCGSNQIERFVKCSCNLIIVMHYSGNSRRRVSE